MQVMIRFALALVLAPILALVFALAPAAAAPVAPPALIQELGNQATAIAADKALADDQRSEKFRDMLARHMDTEAMAQVALGRFWAKASEAERAEYVGAYREYLIRVYGRRLRDFGKSRVEVTGSRPLGPDDVLVDTKLVNDTDVVPISFRVLQRNGANLIIDVLAEGTSILVTQREEFASVIRSAGGVAGLTERLKSIK
jgi:phospholipid transport system substrate-binding protein